MHSYIIDLNHLIICKNLSSFCTNVVFCDSITISPSKNTEPYIQIYLNSIQPRVLCTQFGRNNQSGPGEEDLEHSFMYVCYFFFYHIPLKRGGLFI